MEWAVFLRSAQRPPGGKGATKASYFTLGNPSHNPLHHYSFSVANARLGPLDVPGPQPGGVD